MLLRVFYSHFACYLTSTRLVSLPPHTHISTMQWSLADCDRTNSWPTPLTWQNVTFMRTWPTSSGTVVVDGKFTVNEPFRDAAKRAPVCWGGGTFSAHGCQTLGALPVHRLIICHLSTLLWSPVEIHLRGSVIYFWSHCRLFVSSCVVSSLLLVQWSEIYFWCCSQGFTTGFKDIAVDVQCCSHLMLDFIYWL